MSKIYPTTTTTKDNSDDLYNIYIGVIWGMLCCICICVSFIIIITISIDNDKSSSYSK